MTEKITTKQLNKIRNAEEYLDADFGVNEDTTELEADLIIAGLKKVYGGISQKKVKEKRKELNNKIDHSNFRDKEYTKEQIEEFPDY